MKSFADLISADIAPEAARPLAPRLIPVDAEVALVSTESAPRRFETQVFNALLNQKRALGVNQIHQCKNLRIDGMLELDDARRIGLEIKYG